MIFKMKKILSGIILYAVLLGVMAPASVLAIETLSDTCTLRHDFSDTTNGIHPNCGKGDTVTFKDHSICCVVDIVYTITDWVFYFVLIIAVLMMVIGGFFYITAAGDPEKVGRGKMILTLSVVGLVIAIIAKLIPPLVRFFLGV